VILLLRASARFAPLLIFTVLPVCERPCASDASRVIPSASRVSTHTACRAPGSAPFISNVFFTLRAFALLA